MTQDPFVMSAVDRAQTWVSVCSSSCRLPAEESAAVLASLCGFGSWDVMIYAINNLPRSPYDDEVTPQQLQARLQRYVNILIHEFDIVPPVALIILQQMSPSRRGPFTEFDIVEFLDDDDDDDGEEVDIDTFARNEMAVALALGAECITHKVEVAASLTLSVNWQGWLSALEYLGWDAQELDYEDVPIGDPSLLIQDHSSSWPWIPAYLTNNIHIPDFSGEICGHPTHRLVQFACLGNFMSEWAPQGATKFMILASWPKLITVRSKTYCHIGTAYDLTDGSWTDLLVNRKCRDFSSMHRMNKKVTSIRKGATSLSEPDMSFCKQLALRLGGYDPECDEPEGWEFFGIPADDWLLVAALPEGNAEEFLQSFRRPDLNEYLDPEFSTRR